MYLTSIGIEINDNNYRKLFKDAKQFESQFKITKEEKKIIKIYNKVFLEKCFWGYMWRSKKKN